MSAGPATIANLLSAVREKGDKMTLQSVEILMHLAAAPGPLTMAELSDRTGLNRSSISRNLQTLGSRHRLGDDGFGFVETEKDPRENRRFLVKLTLAGRHFIGRLVRLAEGVER